MTWDFYVVAALYVATWVPVIVIAIRERKDYWR